MRAATGGMTTAAIYACTMTSPAALGAVPEDAEAKSHHLQSGTGFRNPWDSCTEFSALKILAMMTW
jgi:N-acyl-phosphatidylethanolamine-hydrolysing phospholipase D